ncbi:hypothetical protein ACFE04_029205 [Oxalis oulophora]
MGGVVPQLQDHFLDASFMVFNFREGGLIPFAIHLFGLFFIPESPRWLAKTGRKMDFEVALQKLHGLDTDISEDAAEIQIGVGLMVCQQFGGINGKCFYTSDIFEQAGPIVLQFCVCHVPGGSAARETVIYAIIQVIITGLNTTGELVVLKAVNLFDFLTLVRPEHVKLLLLLEEVVDWCSGGSASGDSGCQWRRG